MSIHCSTGPSYRQAVATMVSVDVAVDMAIDMAIGVSVEIHTCNRILESGKYGIDHQGSDVCT
jgi:hypothetical protein